MDTLTLNAPAPDAPPTAIGGGGRFWLAANVVALLVVALVFRAWRLGNIPGVNGDEAWSGVQALALVHGEGVDWWTPTGNPLNVFFLLPLAALHLVFSPSFVVLRSVALASGVLALVANFWLCRRVFDRRTAIVTTVLLALLPVNIAYSRFAWDASQSLLATVLVLYLPLAHYRQRPGGASVPVAGMLALLAAILVHPTNVFAAPLVVVPMIFAWRHTIRSRWQVVAVPARTWTFAALAAGALCVGYLAWLIVSDAASRMRGPQDLAAFVQNYLKLFSGATVYEYISGVDAASGSLAWFAFLPLICKLAFGAGVVLGLWGMMRRLAEQPDDRDVDLVLGWPVMLVGFFVVAGPEAIRPHFERYGICLIAPGAAVLARGWSFWIEPGRRHARAAAWTLALAAWILPVTFYAGYFDFIERTGGGSHRAFHTAAVEPKLAAFGYVRDQAHGPAVIMAGEWWNYWPLAYLAGGDAQIRVRAGHPWERENGSRGPQPSEETWYVEFAGSAADTRAMEAAASGKNARRHVIRDYARRPLLSVVGPVD